MDSDAIGIFFFRVVALMNAVLRAADAARAAGRQDLEARKTPEFIDHGRGAGRARARPGRRHRAGLAGAVSGGHTGAGPDRTGRPEGRSVTGGGAPG